jgi:hypothetical protein
VLVCAYDWSSVLPEDPIGMAPAIPPVFQPEC